MIIQLLYHDWVTLDLWVESNMKKKINDFVRIHVKVKINFSKKLKYLAYPKNLFYLLYELTLVYKKILYFFYNYL